MNKKNNHCNIREKLKDSSSMESPNAKEVPEKRTDIDTNEIKNISLIFVIFTAILIIVV